MIRALRHNIMGRHTRRWVSSVARSTAEAGGGAGGPMPKTPPLGSSGDAVLLPPPAAGSGRWYRKIDGWAALYMLWGLVMLGVGVPLCGAFEKNTEALKDLHNMMVDMGAKLDGRIDSLDAKLDASLNRLDARLDRQFETLMTSISTGRLPEGWRGEEIRSNK